MIYPPLKEKILPKMVILRGNREQTLEFYSNFDRIEIDYIVGTNEKFIPEIKNLPARFKIIDKKFCPAFGFDPMSIIQKKINNLSWQNIQGLEEYIKKSDIVNITDTYYFFNRQAASLARKYNKKVVTVIWTTIPNHPSVWLPPYSLNTKEVVKVTDLFILRSDKAYAFTDSLNIDRKKTIMIHKGVDLKHFYPVPKKDKKFTDILYVGVFDESKGLKDLIFAFEKLIKQGFPVRLILAGEGKLKGFIEEKSKKLPIKNHGFVKYKDLGSVYRRADIFCSPSKQKKALGIKIWEEYFSYTLMEAQASGLAIVTTQSGGIPEEVDNRNYLVEAGNIETLYIALKDLVLDKEKRSFLGKLNRERAEKLFDSKIQARKTEDAILNFFK